jgi:hypothetical protein
MHMLSNRIRFEVIALATDTWMCLFIKRSKKAIKQLHFISIIGHATIALKRKQGLNNPFWKKAVKIFLKVFLNEQKRSSFFSETETFLLPSFWTELAILRHLFLPTLPQN